MFKEMSRIGPRQLIEPVSLGVSLGDIGSVRRPVIYKKYKQERLRVSQQSQKHRDPTERDLGRQGRSATMPITSPELAWVLPETSSPDPNLGAWGGSAGFYVAL